MATEYIDIGPKTWAQTLPILLVLIEAGDAKGRAMAREELSRMARVADMAVAQQQPKEPGTLPNCLRDGHVLGADGTCSACGQKLG